jgi:creatinine amidohydrolase
MQKRYLPRHLWHLLYALVAAIWFASPSFASPANAELALLTWREVEHAIKNGKSTVIIPIGGTEQNGAHMALDKHNQRVKILSNRIALALGNALVAPVIVYVPEGNIDPPTGHMRFAGTISISEAAFADVVKGAAHSVRQAGFQDVVLIGDSGNYQSQLGQIAAALNRQWSTGAKKNAYKPRVHFIAQYYQAAQKSYVRLLREKGLSAAEIGSHAASADTSLMLALDASLVRENKMKTATANADGVGGDARVSSTALGQLGVELIISETVSAIKVAVAKR